MQRRSTTLLLVSAGLLGGCVPDFATDLSQLGEPRLLAIASDPAETSAGKPVSLTALVATPEGVVAPELDWRLCLARKPLTELGPVNPLCLGIGHADQAAEGAGGAGAVEEDPLQALGSGASVTATLSKDVCKLFGPLRPSPMPGEPAGRPVDPDVTGGFYQPVVASLGGVPSLGAIRIDCDPANVNRDEALQFRREYRQNENPRLSALGVRRGDSLDELGDQPLEIKAGSSLELEASWDDCPDTSACGDGYCTADEDAGSCAEDCALGVAHGCAGAERYVWYDRETQSVEPRHEAISVAWYTSSGRFDSEQTGLDEGQSTKTTHTQNVWRVGSAAGAATVWVVVRDSRGGQSWRTQRFTVSR